MLDGYCLGRGGSRKTPSTTLTLCNETRKRGTGGEDCYRPFWGKRKKDEGSGGGGRERTAFNLVIREKGERLVPERVNDSCVRRCQGPGTELSTGTRDIGN